MKVQEVIDTLQEMVKKDPSVANKTITTNITFNSLGCCDLCILESIDSSAKNYGVINFNFGKEYIDEEEE